MTRQYSFDDSAFLEKDNHTTINIEKYTAAYERLSWILMEFGGICLWKLQLKQNSQVDPSFWQTLIELKVSGCEQHSTFKPSCIPVETFKHLLKININNDNDINRENSFIQKPPSQKSIKPTQM